MGIVWEVSFAAFLVLTVVLGGGAAAMSGNALARSWRPLGLVIGYMLLLAAAVRFFHFALAEGTLLSVHYYIVDAMVLAAIATLAYRIARADQMATQYPWLYRRTSPVSWAKR